MSLVTFSDASHTEGNGYDQTGFKTRICARDGCKEGSLFHLINWSFYRQHHMSHSQYSVGIIASETSDDRDVFLKVAIYNLFQKAYLKYELFVDLKAL